MYVRTLVGSENIRFKERFLKILGFSIIFIININILINIVVIKNKLTGIGEAQ